MDVKHKDMQYLGAFAIFKETYKIMNKNRKIFTIVALCFIHPLNYILSGFLGTLNLPLRNFRDYGNISHLFSHKWSFFWPSNVFCIIFLFGYSIFSTAAVVHTVAALYTGQQPSPKDTMSAIAKVGKRVTVTFQCVLSAFLAYNAIAGFALFLIIWTTTVAHGPFGKVDGSILAVFLVCYFVGGLYLVVVLQLSGVVSVLEESWYGFKAMEKSWLRTKEKMGVATGVVFAICLSFGMLLWLNAIDREILFWSPGNTLMIVLVHLVFVIVYGFLVVEARVGDYVVFLL